MGSSTDNEFARWKQLTEGQKSFAVQLLHFFHYRPRCVGRSWTREEVLTWELYRALTLLPRTILLVPFLRLCADAVWTAKPAISELLADPDAIRVVAYPRLNLSGNKRNCASDIGLCRLDDPRPRRSLDNLSPPTGMPPGGLFKFHDIISYVSRSALI